jgi:hypothetical protein
MEVAFRSVLFVHAFFGFIGLVAFWFPVFFLKGSRRHIRAGRIFLYSAYLVAGLGFVMALMIFIDPAGARPDEVRGDPADFLSRLSELLFLTFLALITVATVHHGVRVMQTKRDPGSIRTPFHTGLNAAAVLAGVAILAFGITSGEPILIALSPIGFLIGAGDLRYARRPRASRMAHWYEHLGAMLGGGIAFHTAFAVLGLSRFVQYDTKGVMGVLPWIAPTLVGVPATILFERHFRTKFREPKKAITAT